MAPRSWRGIRRWQAAQNGGNTKSVRLQASEPIPAASGREIIHESARINTEIFVVICGYSWMNDQKLNLTAIRGENFSTAL